MSGSGVHSGSHDSTNVAPSASQLLCKLNELLHADLDRAGYFITACCAIFDAPTRQLSYASAGHPPALLLRADGERCSTLDAGGCLLGIEKQTDFVDVKVQLHTGDIVVFYTDGITEARSPSGEMFGVERLGHAVAANRAAEPEEVVARVIEALETYTGGRPAEDDVTIVVMKLAK